MCEREDWYGIYSHNVREREKDKAVLTKKEEETVRGSMSMSWVWRGSTPAINHVKVDRIDADHHHRKGRGPSYAYTLLFFLFTFLIHHKTRSHDAEETFYASNSS